MGAAAVQLKCKPPLDGSDLSTQIRSTAHRILKEQAAVWGWDVSEWLHSAHATRTINDWWKTFSATDSVNARYAGAEHRKQHPITDAELTQAIQEVSAGIHPSIEDAAFHCQFIADLLEKYGCSVQYLWDAMKRHDPKFSKTGLVEPHAPFTEPQKDQRVSYIKHMQQEIQRDPDYMKKIFWIDQKQVYLVNSHQGFRRWCQRHSELGIKQHDMVLECVNMQQKHKGWSVYYYSIVNAVLGPFTIVMCTGTTGGPGVPETKYIVSQPSRFTKEHVMQSSTPLRNNQAGV